MRKFRTRYMLCFVTAFLLAAIKPGAQPTFPENGAADSRQGHYAFTNATIVKDATTTLTNATLIIRDGKIVAVGTNIKVPAGAVEVNCKNKFIYPSFIAIYADYGTLLPTRTTAGGASAQQPQLETNTKGPFGW